MEEEAEEVPETAAEESAEEVTPVEETPAEDSEPENPVEDAEQEEVLAAEQETEPADTSMSDGSVSETGQIQVGTIVDGEEVVDIIPTAREDVVVVVFDDDDEVLYSASSSTATGIANEATIYNYLRNTLGLNVAAACGVLGNMYWESGQTFSPTAYNSSENAWGIVQWEGSRLTNLQSKYPSSWKTLNSQLAFLKWEFEGGDYKGPSTYSYLKNVANTSDGAKAAAQYFAQYYERCASSTYSYRSNYAVNTFWAYYGGSSSTTISISGANNPGTLTQGGVYSITGTISSGAKLTSVTVGVYDVNGSLKTGKTVNPGSTSYNIKNVDNYILFNKLSPGVYTYKVTASNSSRTVTLVSKVFVVLSTSYTVSEGTYVLEVRTNSSSVIDVASQSNSAGANIQLGKKAASPYQAFYIQKEGSGYYSLRNVGSGMYLDVYGAYSASKTNVQQYSRNSSNAQLWQILPVGDSYCLIPKCSTGCCLDISASSSDYPAGSNIQIYTANLTAAQRFYLRRTNCNFQTGNKISFNLQNGSITGSFASYTANNVNGERGSGYLVINNVSGVTVDTNYYGREVAVDQNGRVTTVREYGSSTQLTVPAGGMVVSGHTNYGAGGVEFTDKLSIGDYVGYNYSTKTVYAYHNLNSYLVNFKYVRSGNTYGILPTPARSGYTFAGWYTSASGGSKVTSSTTYSTSTLYAHWVSNQTTPTLSFASSSLTKAKGDKAFTNKLTENTDGKITYKSSNTKVATVNSSGKVTIKGVGTAKITASAAATSKYAAASKSYTLKVNPSKVTLSSVTNAKGKKLTVKWKKNTTGSGYQIQYSTDKSFKKSVTKKTVKSNKTTSATYSKLTKKKKYYVRIRSYKTVSGTTYYGAWSNVKNVTIKK